MNKIQRLTLTALMAALCYVAFSFLQIKIQTPAGYTSFHLGNVFCLLAALMIGGVEGGIAGAVGMGIGDLLDPVYVITAPKTLILKFFIGFICGTLAHKVFDINKLSGKKLVIATIVSTSGAMLFNMIGEPVLSYLYYDLLLANSEKALSYLAITKFITTAVNSLLAIVISVLLYLPLSSRFKRFFER